jgi:hypothetical protein
MTQAEVAQMRERQLAPPTSCVFIAGDTLVGYGQVLSHPVAIVQRTAADVQTWWRAPDLGCVTLQYRVQRKQADGSLSVTAEGRAKSLRLEEPDPRLFDQGEAYTELKPSDRLRRELRSRGIPWNEGIQRQADRDDQRYSLPRR